MVSGLILQEINIRGDRLIITSIYHRFFAFSFIAFGCFQQDTNLYCYYNDNHTLENFPEKWEKWVCGRNNINNDWDKVCFKKYWIEIDSDPPNIQATRGCGKKGDRNWERVLDSSECITEIDENFPHAAKGEINFCGCTTNYCNTSTFAKPFHFLPLIAVSFVTSFLI